LFALGLTFLAFFLSSCGGSQPEVTRPATVSQPITAAEGGAVALGEDVVVWIPAGALSEDARVTITRASEENPAPGQLEGAQSLGDAFNINMGGVELSGPVRLEVAYDPGLLPEDSPQEAVFLGFYDEENKQWVPVYGTVDLDRHVVVVETDHLSWWNPFSWKWSELVAKITRGLESLLGAVGLPVAEIPQCGAAPAHMTVDFSDSLLACIEGTDAEGRAVLRLANNRAYAVLMHPPPGVQLVRVSHGSLTDAAMALLEDELGGGAVYIPAAGDAEFTLRFERAEEISLSSMPSDMTLALDMLLRILSVLGADPDNVVDGLRCMFEIMTPDRQGTPTIGDLFDVVKDCVGVALKGTAGIVWGTIKTLVTLGAAAGELLVQRTAELFGGDAGRVTVTYNPPGPAPEVTRTQIVMGPYQPDREAVGSCRMHSVRLEQLNAWECWADHERLDLCFSDMSNYNYPTFTDTYVVCTWGPFDPHNEVVKLNLAEPLPRPSPHAVLRFSAWRLELADGTVCDLLLGSRGARGDEELRRVQAGIRFQCDDGWYLTSVSTRNPEYDTMLNPRLSTTSEVYVAPDLWIATKVRWDGYQITESIEVPIRTVWL